jgi:hypothetical protein
MLEKLAMIYVYHRYITDAVMRQNEAQLIRDVTIYTVSYVMFESLDFGLDLIYIRLSLVY